MLHHELYESAKVILCLCAVILTAADSSAPAEDDWAQLLQQDERVGPVLGEAELGVAAGLADEAEQPVQPQAISLRQQEVAQLHGLHGVGVVTSHQLWLIIEIEKEWRHAMTSL